MNKLRVTVLVENCVTKRDLLAEHGLAFWLELGAVRILFDTGQGLALEHNAKTLGISLAQTDIIALSHGHYDHVGGLAAVLRQAPSHVRLFAHPAAFTPKFSRGANGAIRTVGGAETLAQIGVTPSWTQGPTVFCNRVCLTGEIPRQTAFEDTGGAFFTDPAGRHTDKLLDDQAAFVETRDGTVVILGCAHAGVINTLLHIQTLTGQRPLHSVIGGMHLLNASEKRLAKTVTELRRLGVRRLYPCHCTGPAAIARLWHEFPEACQPCPVGTVLEWSY